MNAVPWNDSHGMLSNGQQQDVHGVRHSSLRSQDDAMVGYFFQRPQSDSDLQTQYTKKWAVGDDSVLEQLRASDVHVSELDSNFQALALERGNHQLHALDVGQQVSTVPSLRI
ncbi:PREDICTED: pumilio homolog 2-like [Priapulus caudatus]|uniref:Pumilio homolog 2-like n=1 Tax=Priapulus caudatus TaxID=37621 RepID=A0ABM1ECB4_PRICU|nr:PREDICTED: pumilio homolog 2-like [Priapulus caudatus]